MSIEKVNEGKTKVEIEVLGSESKCAECDNSSSFVVFIWDRLAGSTNCMKKYLCQYHFTIWKKKLPNPLNYEAGFRKL